MSARLRVLLFSHQSEFIFGGEVVTMAFAGELLRQGVDVHFAAPPGPYLERMRAIAPCHEVPSRQFRRRFRELPGTLSALVKTGRALRGIAEQTGAGLLHATSLKAMAFAAPVASKALPVIWHHHDILPRGAANSLWVRALGLRAARVLLPSAAARSALAEAGVPAEKLRLLYNGFRLSDWKPRPARDPGAPLRIGFAGELSRRKGFDELPRLLEELGPDFGLELWIAGEALSEPEEAAALRARLARDPRVRFLGRVEDMKAFYQGIDVLLVPSRQDPLPTVIVEAALSAVPVVGRRVGGIPEMVEEGRTGFLFDALPQAAVALRALVPRWAELSAASRVDAERKFDLERLGAELRGHYAELLAR